MARDTQGSPASEKKLEQYGVWVKVKPREVLESAAHEDSLELSDLETARPASREPKPRVESALTVEEEQLLDELDTELGPQGDSTAVAVPDEEPLLDEAELPEIDEAAPAQGADRLEEELPELDEAPIPPARTAPSRAAPRAVEKEAEIEVTLSEETIEPDHFDDLEALENELATTASSAREAAAASSSAEILSRIEDELRSIRTDLTQLRTELSGLRDKAAAAPAPQGAEASGGFFDEDEDETIALTGDELDNILNNADITEESAEASTADVESSDLGIGDLEMVDLETVETHETVESPGLVDIPTAADATDDILSYETPVLEEDALPVVEDATLTEEETLEADDTLVLTDDSLLPGAGDDAEPMEELPSELVLDDLAPAAAPGATASDDLVEVDLEALPEIESETEPASRPSTSLDDIGDETIDLETLDLGEEPTVIDAVAEQADDLSMVEDAEVILDDEEPAKASAVSPDDITTDDVDLEALALEAEELEGSGPAPHPAADDDLEIGELESVADDAEAVTAAEEVEIPFETEAPTPSPDVDAELEQILDAEDVAAEEAQAAPTAAAGPRGTGAKGASAAGSIDGVPESLKEEIGTVLKYLDNLLEALPQAKIKEFAESDYFLMYKKLFEDLGLGE